MVDNNLDYCGYTDNSFHFSNTYYSIIVKKPIPKFESANCINILLYEKYFNIFSNLTFIKEVFITYTYLIISIIKLKLSKTGSTASYHWI